MKTFLSIQLILLLCFSCHTKGGLDDVAYIKVFSIGRADSVTRYNKGMGMYQYILYHPGSDSLLLRTPLSLEEKSYATYAGLLNSQKVRDTFEQLISALRKYPHPITFDTTNTGDTYCGPDYYAEFRDSEGIKYYNFIYGTDEELNRFSDFFDRQPRLKWKGKKVSNNRVDVDREVVGAMIRLGVYQSFPAPYVPLACDSSIDKAKLPGAWRPLTVFSEGNEKNYTRFTLGKEGKYRTEKIRDGDVTLEGEGTYTLSQDGTLFTMTSEGKTARYQVIRLTRTCFEIKLLDELGNEYTARYDRL